MGLVNSYGFPIEIINMYKIDILGAYPFHM